MGNVISKVLSPLGLFSSPKAETPAPIPVSEPTVMPDADDDALAAARKKRQTAARGRSGRTSTNLSEGETLG